jgi:allophanate hydrolase subunit 1
MQLNESTYETIFLLYIDNELSPKERLEVEAFIADNPSYALEMEALKATVLSAEMIEYPFKENLKEQDWDQTYSTIIKEDLQAIPGLSTSFKNALKKDTAKEGIIVKPFGFNQNKLTYAAIAACLMVFLGYQQLTKIEAIPSSASALVETDIRESSPKADVEKIATNARTKQSIKTIQEVTTKLEASNSSRKQGINVIQQESIGMVEPATKNGSLNYQTVLVEIPITYNNPTAINAAVIATTTIDSETAIDENGSASYEVIDTEDPDRTIFIANFEIDGNKLRGLKRKITILFKNNKSERNY